MALLPRHLRERYREQWSADLRDAEEAGIRPSEIALGALSFAVTITRPLPWSGRTVGPELAAQRSRLAAALALSAALLCLSQFASIVSFGGLTGNTAYDLILFLGSTLLAVYVVIALIVAVALVTLTRNTGPRVRGAVWLLVLASTSALVAPLIDNPMTRFSSIYATPGTLAYAAGSVVLLIAVVLLAREWGWGTRVRSFRRTIGAVLAGLTVVMATALGLIHAVTVWNAREPLVFGWQGGFTVSDGVRTEVPATVAMYNEWLAINAQAERMVAAGFVAWGIAGLLVAGVVFVIVLLSGISPQVCAITTLSLLLIAHSAALSFLQLVINGTEPQLLTDVLLLVGRWVLVAVVLYALGGVRLVAGLERSAQRSSTA
ncbi:MAG: hypothetical protein ACOH1J_06085 [Microbacteriaceae bacterium]